MQNSGNHSIVYRLKHKNGQYIWLSDHVSLIADEAGYPYLQVGNARDITTYIEDDL